MDANTEFDFVITGFIPPPKPEYEKISDTDFYDGDVIKISQNDRDVTVINHINREQVDKANRKYWRSISSTSDGNAPPIEYLHLFKFSSKVIKAVEKIKSDIIKLNPNSDPIFENYPRWYKHPDIPLTDKEKDDLNRAKIQRSYKTALVYEFEDLSYTDMSKSREEYLMIKRRNKHLCKMINELPELTIIDRSDENPYLDTLDFIKPNRKARKV